jgi:uncharacterized membrane protein YbjE (DUF340 family)
MLKSLTESRDLSIFLFSKHFTAKGRSKEKTSDRKHMGKDIIKLVALLVVLLAIIFGLYVFGQSVDNKSKYQHPITQPGARW